LIGQRGYAALPDQRSAIWIAQNPTKRTKRRPLKGAASLFGGNVRI